MRISYSAYDNFNGCPQRYKFQYIDHIQVPKKIELEFGSLMHDLVESALKKDPIIPSLEELTKLYEENFSKITFEDDLKKEQYHGVGLNMLKTFHDALTPALRDTIATEKRFYLPLNQKHTLSGAIDRIDKLPFGAFEVIDYKTNFKPKTQEEIDKDKQLGIYRYAIGKLWPEAKDVRLSLYFLRTNMKLTTTRRDEEVESIIEDVIKTADKIESETEFLPKKNPLCDWCDFQHLCPLMKQKMTSGKQLTADSYIDNTIEQYLEAHRKIIELEPKIHTHFNSEKIEAYHHNKGVISRSKTGKFSIRKK